MEIRNKLGLGTVLLGSISLAACGGGDSDSGGGSGPSASLTLDSGNYGSKSVTISAESNIEAIYTLLDDLDAGEELVYELTEIVGDQSGWVSGTTDCDVSGTATVSFDGDDWDDDETWTFNKCVVTSYSYGPVELNGTYRYVDRLTNETDETESWKGYDRYDINGELKDTQTPIALKGGADWSEVYNYVDDSIDADMTVGAMEYKEGDTYVAVSNGSTSFKGSYEDSSYSISAKVLGSAIDGYVNISTPTPIITSAGDCPTEGVVQLESNGTAQIRYGSSAGGTATAVAIWIDGQTVDSRDNCTGLEL